MSIILHESLSYCKAGYFINSFEDIVRILGENPIFRDGHKLFPHQRGNIPFRRMRVRPPRHENAAIGTSFSALTYPDESDTNKACLPDHHRYPYRQTPFSGRKRRGRLPPAQPPAYTALFHALRHAPPLSYCHENGGHRRVRHPAPPPRTGMPAAITGFSGTRRTANRALLVILRKTILFHTNASFSHWMGIHPFTMCGAGASA